ncbi:MAG: sensor histidine kinase [Chitinophagales bacterium]|nr:sensor histidine kinase [Chitinophagales bacterium]
MHNREFFLKYKLHHLFIWMLVFGLWFFLRRNDYSKESTAFQVTLVKVVDLAIMVYITNYLLLPKLFYKKRYAGFILIFLGMIIAGSLLKMQVLGRLLNAPALLDFSSGWRTRIYDNMIPHFFLVTAGAAFKLMFDYTRMQQRLAEVAKEKAETELNFLKSQINPHFLFNSLNSVYFLIRKDNAEAREALHKFSEMLRYQLYEMGGDKIPIEKEIRYLHDYVDLQHLRKDENYTVSFQCAPEVKGFSIEPLLLIPFVENAFKYISHHQGKPNYVKLAMNRSNGSFSFSVENSKENMSSAPAEEKGGIGLTNVKRRLELLYPGKHELTITDSNNKFSVQLNLSLS